MVFQRKEFCFCNSPVVEMAFPGRVNMTPFSPAFLKDCTHSHCLTCPLSLEVRVKEMEMACLLHPHLICRSLCNNGNGIHVFLPLQSALLAFPCSRPEFQYILHTKRWSFYLYFRQGAGSAEGVREEIATSWRIADLFLRVQKPPELVYSCMGSFTYL